MANTEVTEGAPCLQRYPHSLLQTILGWEQKKNLSFVNLHPQQVSVASLPGLEGENQETYSSHERSTAPRQSSCMAESHPGHTPGLMCVYSGKDWLHPIPCNPTMCLGTTPTLFSLSACLNLYLFLCLVYVPFSSLTLAPWMLPLLSSELFTCRDSENFIISGAPAWRLL